MLTVFLYVLVAVLRTNCMPSSIDFRDKDMMDLTYPLDNLSFAFPGIEPFVLTTTHNGTNSVGTWFINFKYAAGEHFGTHMDAPFHFDPNGWTLDQIPIDRFIAPAIVVDISAKAEKNPNAVLGVDDLMKWEKQHGQIPKGSVVLVNSGYGKYWKNESMFLGLTQETLQQIHNGAKKVLVNYPGCGKEAAEFLVANRSIIGLGVDTTSLDAGNESDAYPCHKALLQNKMYGLENVANLHKLPPIGITLIILPLKSKGGSGGPTRIIAFVDKNKKKQFPFINSKK